jgi:protoporphyrinogen oxidase
VGSAFPAWVRYEQEHGSMVRGVLRNRTSPPHGLPKGTFSLRGGIGTLTDTLAADLGDAVRTATTVDAIEPGRSQVTVRANGRTEVHDQLLITVPQAVVRPILPGMPHGWLDDLPASPLAAIHLAYEGDQVPGGLEGFGWLVHSEQRIDALGCLWVSGTFPTHAPAGKHLLRLMVGGTRAPELAERPDDALITHARQLLRDVQGITATPLFAEVNRAVIPQYPVGFARRLRLLDQVHPRVRFGGWWWGQLGVAASAEFAAQLVRAWRSR